MPHKELMTWNAAEQRWHKRYRGKSYAASPRKLGCDRSKAASRDAANRWWEGKRLEIDAALFQNSEQGQALSAATTCAQRSLKHAKQLNDGDRYSLWLPIAHALQSQNENQEPLPDTIAADPEGALSIAGFPKLPALPPDQLRIFIDELFRGALARATGIAPSEPWNHKPASAAESPTIEAAITRFVAFQRPNLCAERVVSAQSDLKKMLSVLAANDANRLTNTIDDSDIDNLLTPHEFSADWAEGTFFRYYAEIRRFMRWCARRKLLTLPLNLCDLTIRVPSPGKQPTFTALELRAILAKLDELAEGIDRDWAKRTAANDKRCPSMRRSMKPRRNGPRFFKLCVLLLLNIGGTQADVSDLTQSEVDWMDGRITRKRSKMRKHPSAQTVCYKLWPETFRLLKHFRSTDSTLAIVNEDGLPLRSAREEKGKLKKSDAIKNLLFRLREKLNWPDGKLLKSLRKTGATLLKAQGADIELRELYLGHAPATIREIHYEQDSPEFQARFDAAIVKLGAAFGQ